MIKLKRPDEAVALGSRTVAFLNLRQVKANGFAARTPPIETAWASFLRTKSKAEVSEALDVWTHTKCAYCEQIAAKDIEHFYPKSDYPGKMFCWTNFLRGCKNCNNAKLSRFPMANGVALLIDPTTEEPMDYIRWDPITGSTVVNPTQPFQSKGIATRDLFDLDQEPVREERRKKLLLVEYLLARVTQENPVTSETRERLRDELSPSRPWLAIIRQLFLTPGTKQPLIASARSRVPEIDVWLAAWM